jgi:hypothetical protein
MTTNSSNGTISEFLLNAGTEYFVIDVSRTRQIMDNQEFFECELNQQPFPRPRQGHAWLCVVFWNKQLNHEHYIWFIKLPVDEQSLLMPAARDQFLHIVVQALGREMEQMQNQQGELPENPFVFAPSQQLLADCNATIRKHLGVANRPELKKAIDYLKAPSVQAWDNLAVQDISDVAVNVDDPQIRHAIEQNLEVLPHAVNTCLLSGLESTQLEDSTVEAILSYHSRCEQTLAPMLLRALGNTQTAQVQQYIHQLIQSEQSLDVETLVVIAGRHWHALIPDVSGNQQALAQYFEKLVQADASYALFRGIFADLVQIPQLRVFVLATLRAPKQSEDVSKAIASLFEQQAKP